MAEQHCGKRGPAMGSVDAGRREQFIRDGFAVFEGVL